MRRVFHILPKNLIPSGGIKCHYQLCELETAVGYESYIVYDSIDEVPMWFEHRVQHITTSDMQGMADKRRDIIIGWEDPEPLVRSGFYNKVAYIQGEVFVNRSNPYHGIIPWFSTEFNYQRCPNLHHHPKFVVSPFIDPRIFFNDSLSIDAWKARPNRIMIQERKAGWEAIRSIQACTTRNLSFELIKALGAVHVVPDCSESEFANELRRSQIFIPHSAPEGLGLPGLEAMACGCLVVGFTGGGGTTYMEHGVNCLIADDNKYDQLAYMLENALRFSDGDTRYMLSTARTTADDFSNGRTLLEIVSALLHFGALV